MVKKNTFGFRTPVRRKVKNISGNKVGGDLSGGECKIIFSKRLTLEKNESYSYKVDRNFAKPLFNSNIGILAIGGYFIADNDLDVIFTIHTDNEENTFKYQLEKKRFYALGHDLEINLETSNVDLKVEIEFIINRPTDIDYSHFSYGFIDKDWFIENEESYKHYSGVKKRISFPEQFYFNDEKEIENSVNGNPIIIKSCNRCQRYLPINPYNQRIQLAFGNHCTTKAPCTHKNFSKYKITMSDVADEDIKDLVKNSFENLYTIDSEGYLKSHYGHQLECKACKKFFVNAALNNKRTSSQHREDSLRRRAFDLLCRELIGQELIYHEFRLKKDIEFDKYIWLKFNKKCFNCDADIISRKQMDLDHTMPLSHLYPLDESATCLCPKCNSEKGDIFPVNFYDGKKLKKLSMITGLSLEILMSKKPNQKVINELKRQIVWFIEDFLANPDYHKLRDGKKAADSIVHSLNKVISKSDYPFDILDEYRKNKKP